MDNALQALLSWQFLLFCVAVVSVTYVVRTVVDYVFGLFGRMPKESHLWTELILPILPVILGSVGAFVAQQYPYPIEITSASGRFAFGLCAGLLSGLLWRWIKSAIGRRIAKTDIDDNPSEGI